ncbi:hypothetical protein SLEP1_g42287 [Rubroshorea leprosula]|nr:hypothetical protein SLEP1_g42287 [Rubroshorea leprosula]
MLLLKLRLMVETAATFSRCVTMYILIAHHTDMEKGIVFALSQTAHGASLFIGYWSYFLLQNALKISDIFPFSFADKETSWIMISSFWTCVCCLLFNPSTS